MADRAEPDIGSLQELLSCERGLASDMAILSKSGKNFFLSIEAKGLQLRPKKDSVAAEKC